MIPKPWESALSFIQIISIIEFSGTHYIKGTGVLGSHFLLYLPYGYSAIVLLSL